MKSTVTRFAPSPTGFIHVGGVRTALFAWLVAKQANGKFIFRIEDTDKQREVVGAEEHIIKSLKWLGISWNEGPDIGGPQAPYRQSDRLIIYADWAQRLIAEGRAYADPYTPDEVQAFREEAKKQKKPFLYRNYRPENPPKWDGTQPLRFKSDPKSYTWNDEVLGDLSAGEEAVDDFILIKSDGYPTYNFCHIVDDALMGVTHVIRSQEFIASVPKFLNLYEALKIDRPIFATLPFVMAIDGHKKLSKRDGAKDILDYAREGYLPEAMVNFLASLGWNDGTEQEIFTMDELVSKFSLQQVQKSPARFDEKRLLWMNGQWIRNLSIEELYKRAEAFWPAEAIKSDESYKIKVLELAHERLKTLSDLSSITSFLFTDPKPNLELFNANKQLSKMEKSTLAELLNQAADSLNNLDSFDAESIQLALNKLLELTNQKPMILFSCIRIATTWAPFSPDLAPSLALLGKDSSVKRLKNAASLLA
jgi:glutamyl-tRNA synthetase